MPFTTRHLAGGLAVVVLGLLAAESPSQQKSPATQAATAASQPADSALPKTPAATHVVATYEYDFTQPPDEAWSKAKTSTTPAEQRPFLGPFGSEAVSLTLNDLPEHKLVEISVRLLVIRSWDAYHPQYGQDTWTLAVKDGPTLLHTSFGHPDHARGPQAYPGWHGEDRVPSATGALQTDKLGYEFQNKPCDAEYQLELALPHRGDSLTLTFSADMLAVGLTDESWGLENVQVRLRERFAPAKAEQINRWIEALEKRDPRQAYDAYWKIAATGPAALDPLQQTLGNISLQSSVRDLVEKLQSADFSDRQVATELLLTRGIAIAEELEKMARDPKLTPEQKQRITVIRQKLKPSPELDIKILRRQRLNRLIELIQAGTQTVPSQEPGKTPAKSSP